MSITGLSQTEAENKLKECGLNEIKKQNNNTQLKILYKQVRNNFLIYVLLAAVIMSYIVGKTATAYTILAVISLIIAIGFVQEYKAEKAIGALKKMVSAFSLVLRDGKIKKIQTANIVPGDILILRMGERIPADAVILEQTDLKVDESMLTGESSDVSKEVINKKNGDHKHENQIFMGTFILSGKCTARASHTGMNTEYGKIARMISTAEKSLHMQNKVNSVAKYMTIAALTVSLLTGAVMYFRAGEINSAVLVDILLVMIALSVAAIPEGFPVVLTTALATGVTRMARKNAIVNKMSIIETLGETTVVCADKTGTITTGEMTVKKIFFDNKIYQVEGSGFNVNGDILHNSNKIKPENNKYLELLFRVGTLCNDSQIEEKLDSGEYVLNGSSTESALLMMSEKAGVFREDIDHQRIEELPFSSERKKMTVYCQVEGKKVVYSKGGPDIIINDCDRYVDNGEVKKLSKAEIQKIERSNQNLANEGLRTIALAYKDKENGGAENLEENLVFLGLVGMEDPPREEVEQSIELCNKAGINVKMITGDNLQTAIAIAKQVGINHSAITGAEIDGLTEDELKQVINKYSIFARVRPEHKLRIVKALKERGEIVTMTGDGVNDSPALKEADIGVAMGKNGTDVSREVADITLKDDNFATIVEAIKEGRTIFTNIRKFITYQLSVNFAELSIIFFGILIGLPLPLLPLQILFMNLVTDDLPAISLSFNPASLDTMRSKPRTNSKLVDIRSFVLLAIIGSYMAVITLGAYSFVLLVLKEDLVVARTVAFVALICLEVVAAYNFRSLRSSFFDIPVTSNIYLFYASIISILATIIVMHTPAKRIFEVTSISGYYWALMAVMSLTIILFIDLIKRNAFLRKRLINSFYQ